MTARAGGQRPERARIRIHPRVAVFVIARMRRATVRAVIRRRLRMQKPLVELDEAGGKVARLGVKGAQVFDEAAHFGSVEQRAPDFAQGFWGIVRNRACRRLSRQSK